MADTDKKESGGGGPPRVPTSVKVTVFCIILTELCERLTYYSAAENMIMFTTSKLEMTSYEATSAKLIFSGTAFVVPVLTAGYISDTFAGKYNTILGGSIIYLFGLVLLPAAAADYHALFWDNYDLKVNVRKLYYFMGLAFVAIGTGGIKTNVGPLGAEQVEPYGESKVKSFFNWFYFAINIGATIAFLGVGYVQQNISFLIGYSVPLFSLIIALVAMVAAKPFCKNKSPSGNIITDIVRLCVKTRCGFRCGDGEVKSTVRDMQLKEDLKGLLKIMPIFFLHLVYFTPYVQSQTLTTLQGLRMDVSVGSFKTPVTALNVVNTAVVLILIPIADRVVYPLLERRGLKPTQLQRIGFGYLLNLTSCVLCGVVEIFRKQSISSDGLVIQNLGGKDFKASPLSIYWQIPQIAILAASEIFSNITTMEFAFAQAPVSMKSVVMSLYLVAAGLGGYVSQGILKAVTSLTGTEPPDAWFPDEINEGKAENIFFLDAGIMSFGFIMLLIYAKLSNIEERGKDITQDETEKPTEKSANGKRSTQDSEAVLVKYEKDSRL